MSETALQIEEAAFDKRIRIPVETGTETNRDAVGTVE